MAVLKPCYAIQYHFILGSGALVRLDVYILIIFFSSNILSLFMNHTLEFILSIHSLFPLLFSCGNFCFFSL